MGVYVYSLRSPKHTVSVTLPDGRTVTAGQLKYSHKPISDVWGPEPLWQRAANARISKMERVWGDKTPEFVVRVGNDGRLVEGLVVMDWHRQNLHLGDRIVERVSTSCVSTCDDPNWGGRKSVGTLRRVNGAWHVV